jgi:hypothetical protein
VGDDETIGRMLGFPECCREFFAREWARGGSYDLTRAMRTVDGPWEANIMLRWLGVRLVPHLPCSADCTETGRLAGAYLAAGRRMGVDVDALEALLRLPVTHEDLNGVAIVSTPHFRFMVGTDPTPERIVTERAGLPRREPCGCCKDPYCTGETHHHDAASPAAEESHWDAGLSEYATWKDLEPPTWEDNGFSSAEAMEAAHQVVLRAVGDVSSAADLGCGDGRLLAAIAQVRGDEAEGAW